MKSIAVIGNVKKTSTKRIVDEAKQRGLEVDSFSSNGVRIELNSGAVTASFNGVSLDNYDAYLFRGIRENVSLGMALWANSLTERGKKVVERSIVNGRLPNDKLISFSRKNHYKVPRSQIFFSKKEAREILSSFPLILKTLQGSMGRGVFLVENKEMLESVLGGVDSTFLVQQYLPISWDARVLVVGGRVVGGIKRYRMEDDFLTTRPGGKREEFVISGEVERAAKEAVERQGIEIAGVDLAICDDNIYIFEVNASPQFKVFERVTGINVAGLIVEHLSK